MTQAEIKFLKRSVPSGNPIGLRWDWPLEDDVDIIEVSRILAGPAKPMVENKVRGKPLLYFSDEEKAVENYKTVAKFGFHSPKKAKH